MSVREYIGARYVPLFSDPFEWDNTKTYEPLTIVLHQGDSYTSKQYTPVGIDIENTSFWARTGNYNAQIESYHSDVTAETAARTTADATLQSNIEAETAARTTADATLQSNIEAETAARTASINEEKTARETADASITKSINEEATRAVNAENAIKTDVEENTTQIAVNSSDIAALNLFISGFSKIIPINKLNVSSIPTENTLVIVNDGLTHNFTNIIFPKNISFYFLDGKFSGSYTINGKIVANNQQIFDVNSTITINKEENQYGIPEWFGCVPNDNSYASSNVVAIQKTIDVFSNIKFNIGVYHINNSIYVSGINKEVVGSNFSESGTYNASSIYNIADTPIFICGNSESTTYECNSLDIRNLHLCFASGVTNNAIGIKAISCVNIRINNICIENANIGILESNINGFIENVTIVLCTAATSPIGIYITSGAGFYGGVGTNPSMYLNQIKVFGANNTYIQDARAIKFDGIGLADNFLNRIECAYVGYGLDFDFTNSNLDGYSNEDFRASELIFDNVYKGIYFHTSKSSVSAVQCNIDNSYILGGVNSSTVLVDLFSNSEILFENQIVITNTQLIGRGSDNTDAIAINAKGGGLVFDNISFRNIAKLVRGSYFSSKIKGDFQNTSTTITTPLIETNSTRCEFDISHMAGITNYVAFSGTYSYCLFNVKKINALFEKIFNPNSTSISSITSFYTNNSEGNAAI